MKRQFLLFTAPHQVEIHEEDLPPIPPGQVLLQAHLSAISPGTELLMYQGHMPSGMRSDSSLPALSDRLAYPLRYGYALVGEVVECGAGVDPELVGRRALALHPHADLLHAAPEDLVWLEPGSEPQEAVFMPMLETALTLVHDGAPLLGELVITLGQGLIGLLTTALLSQMQLQALITLEPQANRRRWSLSMGADQSIDALDPGALNALETELGLPDPHAGADLCYELSGQPAALDQAIRFTRFSGRVIIGSWYGTRPASVDLGGRFHRSRIQITSSQVSSIQPALSGRWTKRRMLDLVQGMLPVVKPARLITHTFPFENAPAAYALLDGSPDEALAVVLEYGR